MLVQNVWYYTGKFEIYPVHDKSLHKYGVLVTTHTVKNPFYLQAGLDLAGLPTNFLRQLHKLSLLFGLNKI